MSTTEIIRAIDRLPIAEQLQVIEQTLKKIRATEVYHQMTLAAEDLADEYKVNKELTIFSDLDMEQFYEAR